MIPSAKNALQNNQKAARHQARTFVRCLFVCRLGVPLAMAFLIGFGTACADKQYTLGESIPEGCIDSTIIDPMQPCTMQYDPVCGCNGVTYANACVAKYTGGVTFYEAGECPETMPRP